MDAPCLIKATAIWRANLQLDGRELPSWPAWNHRLQELARLPPTNGAYREEESIATVEETQHEMMNLRQRYQQLKALPASADDLQRLEAEITRVRQFFEQELPPRRAEDAARTRAHALRPQLWDPTRQPMAEYLQRVRRYCTAMLQEVRRVGASPVPRADRELTRNAGGLLDYQLHRYSYAQIVAAERGKGHTYTDEAVKRAISRLARLLKWHVRSTRPGKRPR